MIPQTGLIADWVSLYAPVTEAPPESHFAVAVTLVSAAIGWNAWTDFGGKREPANVSTILVGESGAARKTTVINIASELMRNAYVGVDAQREDALRVHPASRASDAGIIAALAPLEQDTARRWEMDPPPRNLWTWDEVGQLMTQDGSWRTAARGILLGALEGRQPGSQTAKKGPTDQLPLPSRCSLSVVGTMTTAELEDKTTDLGIMRDGFLGRFLVVNVRPSDVDLAFAPVETVEFRRAREQLTKRVRAICDDPPTGPISTLMTEHAREMRAAWYSQMKRAIRAIKEEEVRGIVGSHFARQQVTAAKVSLVLATCEGSREIHAEHVAQGQALVDVSLREIKRLAEISMRGHESTFRRLVHASLSVHGKLSVADAMIEVRPRELRARDAKLMIDALHDAGDIVVKPVQGEDGSYAQFIYPSGYRNGDSPDGDPEETT